MKKMYSEKENWNEKNYKESFENLSNDGFDFDKLEIADWFTNKIDNLWICSVLSKKYAKKVIKESEKAIQYEIVNQYGEINTIWFPKSVLNK